MNGIRPPFELISYNDTEILLLGEHHTHPIFESYIHQKLEEFSPETVCVESCPQRYSMHKNSETKSSVGVTAATKYIRKRRDGQLILIDQTLEDFLDQIRVGGLTEDSNSIPKASLHSIEPLEVNFSALREYNETVKQSYPAKWDSHYHSRSRFMAQLLLDLINNPEVSRHIAVVTGLSHAIDIYDIIAEQQENLSPMPVSEDRILASDQCRP